MARVARDQLGNAVRRILSAVLRRKGDGRW